MVKGILWILTLSFVLPWGLSFADDTLSQRSNVRRGGTTRIDNYHDRDRYDNYDASRYYDEDKDRPMSRSDRLKADQEQRRRDREERKSINRQQSIRSY